MQWIEIIWRHTINTNTIKLRFSQNFPTSHTTFRAPVRLWPFSLQNTRYYIYVCTNTHTYIQTRHILIYWILHYQSSAIVRRLTSAIKLESWRSRMFSRAFLYGAFEHAFATLFVVRLVSYVPRISISSYVPMFLSMSYCMRLAS